MDAFEHYFQAADADRDGRISGAEAVAFFQGCGLPQMTLAKVWQYADSRQAGFLHRPEFFHALRLITVAQSGRDINPDVARATFSGPAVAQIPAPRITVPPRPGAAARPGGPPGTMQQSGASGAPGTMQSGTPGGLQPGPLGPAYGRGQPAGAPMPGQPASGPSWQPATAKPAAEKDPFADFGVLGGKKSAAQTQSGAKGAAAAQSVATDAAAAAALDAFVMKDVAVVPPAAVSSAVVTAGGGQAAEGTAGAGAGAAAGAAGQGAGAAAGGAQGQEGEGFLMVPGDPQPWPRMGVAEAQRYAQVFVGVDGDRDGKITGKEARKVLMASQVPIDVLKQVWDLSDEDKDGNLTLREFCTASYLIERYKSGRKLPPTLPRGFHVDEPVQDQRTAIAAKRLAEAQAALTQHSQGVNVPTWQRDPGVLVSPTKGAPRKDAAMDQKKKAVFFRDKMQEIVMFKSRCDLRLADVSEQADVEKKEMEELARKYDDKYKAAQLSAGKLAAEERALQQMQEKAHIIMNATSRLDRGGDPNQLLQDKADRLALEVEEMRKAVFAHATAIGLKVRPLVGSETPFGWQANLQEKATDWDDEWDDVQFEGLVVVRDIGDTPLAENEDPFPRPKSKKQEEKGGASAATETGKGEGEEGAGEGEVEDGKRGEGMAGVDGAANTGGEGLGGAKENEEKEKQEKEKEEEKKRKKKEKSMGSAPSGPADFFSPEEDEDADSNEAMIGVQRHGEEDEEEEEEEVEEIVMDSTPVLQITAGGEGEGGGRGSKDGMMEGVVAGGAGSGAEEKQTKEAEAGAGGKEAEREGQEIDGETSTSAVQEESAASASPGASKEILGFPFQGCADSEGGAAVTETKSGSFAFDFSAEPEEDPFGAGGGAAADPSESASPFPTSFSTEGRRRSGNDEAQSPLTHAAVGQEDSPIHSQQQQQLGGAADTFESSPFHANPVDAAPFDASQFDQGFGRDSSFGRDPSFSRDSSFKGYGGSIFDSATGAASFKGGFDASAFDSATGAASFKGGFDASTFDQHYGGVGAFDQHYGAGGAALDTSSSFRSSHYGAGGAALDTSSSFRSSMDSPSGPHARHYGAGGAALDTSSSFRSSVDSPSGPHARSGEYHHGHFQLDHSLSNDRLDSNFESTRKLPHFPTHPLPPLPSLASSIRASSNPLPVASTTMLSHSPTFVLLPSSPISPHLSPSPPISPPSPSNPSFQSGEFHPGQFQSFASGFDDHFDSNPYGASAGTMAGGRGGGGGRGEEEEEVHSSEEEDSGGDPFANLRSSGGGAGGNQHVTASHFDAYNYDKAAEEAETPGAARQGGVQPATPGLPPPRSLSHQAGNAAAERIHHGDALSRAIIDGFLDDPTLIDFSFPDQICGTWHHNYTRMHQQIRAASKNPSGDPPADTPPVKFLTFDGLSHCDSLGETLMGLTSAFTVAILTNRAFVIKHPCIPMAFEPALIDWQPTEDVGFEPVRNETFPLEHPDRAVTPPIGASDIVEINLELHPEAHPEKVFPQVEAARNLRVVWNKDLLVHMLKGANESVWGGRLKDMGVSIPYAFGCFVRYLLRPKPEVWHRMQPFEKQLRGSRWGAQAQAGGVAQDAAV
ncbi:unnamed protein product [Closterium sp. Naga37s-1]|nr:unnamed protein product [Closterium sp. Naga37s-1]